MQCILLHLHLLISLRSECVCFGINNIIATAKIVNSLFLFYFAIVRYVVMDVVTLPNLYSEGFLFTSSGYDMAPTCDLDTKNYFNIGIENFRHLTNFTTCLRHV